MRTIDRRFRRRHAVLLAGMLTVVVLALLLAWVFMVIWIKGGPQPVHRIVIALPAPQRPASAGRGA